MTIRFIDTTSDDIHTAESVRAIVRYYPRGDVRPDALIELEDEGTLYTTQQDLADAAHTMHPAQGSHVVYIMDETSIGQDHDRPDSYTWWPSSLVTDDE